LSTVRRAALAGLLSSATALTLGIGSATALGDTFTLGLSGPSSGTVGNALAITAAGTDPTDGGALYLEIDVIPVSLTTTCPTGYLNGSQLASSTSSGALVAFDQPEDFDATGAFTNVNAYTPAATGSFLLCGYTDDGAGDTLAITSRTVSIAAAQRTPPVSKPTNTAKPRVTRSGNTLRCSLGRWGNAPQTYAYHWLVAHKIRSGAHKRTFGSAGTLRGRKVQCRVIASNSAGSTTATSEPFTVH
jgi:hypothetical protein